MQNSKDKIRDKLELYIVSLWLFFLLIIIVTIDIPLYFGTDWKFIGIGNLLNNNWIAIVSLVGLWAGLRYSARFERKLEGSKQTNYKITKIQNANYEHLTFLTTYIIPLVVFDLQNVRYVIVLFILLVVIGIIYVKTDMYYANPSLALLGYHIYKVDICSRHGVKTDIIFISKESLHSDMYVNYKKLDEEIYFVGAAK